MQISAPPKEPPNHNMSELSRPAVMAMNAADLRTIGTVSLAHFVSHFNQMMLPPLFDIIRGDFAASYTEFGLAFVVFNVVTAALQVPIGFVVDRVGARRVLIAGLVIQGIAFTVAGLAQSLTLFVAMFALAGLGNTVFHPADYAFLSKRVSHRSIGLAFSFHSFAGMMGAAVGPAAILLLYAMFGWRGAFIGSMSLTWLSAAVMLIEPDDGGVAGAGRKPAADAGPGSLRLLASPPILVNFLFFVFLAFVSIGITNYLVVALQALHGTGFASANTALSAFLLMTAAGVMTAGLLVNRIKRHAVLAAAGMTIFAAGAAAIGLTDLGDAGFIAVAGVIGFASGATYPSRDMLVRDVTPPGAFGKVFGFVTSGFNVAGIAAPFIYGPLMDHGMPGAVFLSVAAGALFTVVMVFGSRRAASH